MATQTTIDYAMRILPEMIRCAQLRQTITYGDLAHRADLHHRALPWALGYIRDELCDARGLPLLNVIVINKDTGEPGVSFLPDGTDHLSRAEYTQAFELIRDQVFACDRWDSLMKDLGLVSATF